MIDSSGAEQVNTEPAQLDLDAARATVNSACESDVYAGVWVRAYGRMLLAELESAKAQLRSTQNQLAWLRGAIQSALYPDSETVP